MAASLAEIASLHGSCSCGRNQYLIALPSDPAQASSQARIVFDDSAESRLTHSTPLPTFLRVPLSSLQSTTFAFYPEETPLSIRRVFTPFHAPHTKRHFCGFCGAQLSFWQERPRSLVKTNLGDTLRAIAAEEDSNNEADWICVNLGSLEAESLKRLEERGVLGGLGADDEYDEDEEEDDDNENYDYEDNKQEEAEEMTAEAPDEPLEKAAQEEQSPAIAQAAVALPVGASTSQRISKVKRKGNREVRGQPWFEEVIEGTKLGKIKKRRGGEVSRDGKSRWEWSVVEFEEGEGPEGNGEGEGKVTGKRKAGEMGVEAETGAETGADIEMGGH